jgi:Na+/H+ antiporter NhaD/arsenite permease-like protein
MAPGPSAPNVIFGWSPVLVSSALFLATYALVISERINRSIVALLGAALIILLGVLSQKSALSGIDFNTLGLLLGMMVIVNITGRSGVFQFVAIWSAKKVGAHPLGVLVMLSVVTALFSALLDNVTTVLLVVPVTLLITEELKVSPYPFLVAEIVMSNVGGTATLIGDPPNIMIGSAVPLSFNAFLAHLAPIIVLAVMPATLALIALLWARKLRASDEDRRRIMEFAERDAITDWRLLKQSLTVLALVLGGFVAAHPLGQEPATIAIAGAALLLLLDNYHRSSDEQSKNVHHAFAEAEWITLFFFVGLFVLVHALETAGVIHWLAERLLAATGGDLKTTALAILWGSAVLSAFVDNIPFVATMIPLVKSMAPAMGGEQALAPLWWALALGACLGGNGTLIGASANLVVAGFAERAGQPIRFLAFMKSAFGLMLLSVALSHVYIVLRYF